MPTPGNYDHVTQQDYDSIAGPDWPAWEHFCQHKNVADFVYQEIDAMIKRPVNFDHGTWCVLPFYGLEFWAGSSVSKPAQTFCCLVPDGADRDAVKQDMLAGRRPRACQACWNLEDQGLISDRKIKNRLINQEQLAEIQGLLSKTSADQLAFKHYKIDANNTCNSTCVTCDSAYSTAWAQLQRKNGVDATPSWSMSLAELDASIDYAGAQSMGFRGGEPLLSDQTWHVLEQLLLANNTVCDINFTTNGSISLSSSQQDLIGRFDSVTFNFSVDGVGAVFEYVRYPLLWTDLVNNVKSCRDRGIQVTASYTISNLNILYHPQTRAWFEQNQIPYSLNPVYHPVHFRPAALPQSIKDHMINQQPHDSVTAFWLHNHTAQDQIDYELFRTKIAQQDDWKGIKLDDYLPELARLLG